MTRTFRIKQNKLPDMPAMMVRTVQALIELGGSASISELDDKVSELEGVTEAELTLVMNNDKRPRFNYFCAWTRTFLKKADIATNSARGVWVLSSKKSLKFDQKAAEEAYKRINKEENYKSKQRAEENNQLDSNDSIPEDETTEWKQHLLNAVSSMAASEFEKLSQRLLREAGFIRVEVRGQSGDGGIDGVGILRMNLISFQVYFQCKKWSQTVGAKEIRDFRGALQGRADKGLFITTSSFSKPAVIEATRDGAIPIDLIDGERLTDLLKEYRLGVSVELIEDVNVHTEWFKTLQY